MHARLYLPAKANRRTCARKRGTGPAQRAAAFVAELQPSTWQGHRALASDLLEVGEQPSQRFDGLLNG